MKTELLIETDKVVKIDLEKIKDKIDRFNNLLRRNYDAQSENFLNTSYDQSNEQISKKNLIQNIVLLMNDLEQNMNFREVCNIIIKNSPNDKVEEDIISLFEGLSVFVKSKKIIHQNNVFMFYNIISHKNEKQYFQSFPFRKHNLSNNGVKTTFKVVDYNKIPVLFDQLINFINNGDDQLCPWINMQIVHIHNLAISPFENKNILFSKILSIWYLLTYGKSEEPLLFPIQSYLEVLQLNPNEYFQVVKNCLIESDYTDFISFIIEKIIGYQGDKILTAKINLFLHKNNKLYLAEYEKKFLFVIIYFRMNEFDWKLFKKLTKWPSSKQYIIRNLSNLVKYSLLSSKNWKNRKFFYQSRLLRRVVEQLQNQVDL